jgi:hypothetical protein
MSAQPRRRNGEGHQYKGLSLVILVISFLGRMLALRRNRQAFSPTTSAVSPRGEPGEAPEIRGEDGQDSVHQSPHGRRSRRQLHCCGTRGSIAGHSRLILPVGLIVKEPTAAITYGGWARDIRGSRATGETLGLRRREGRWTVCGHELRRVGRGVWNERESPTANEVFMR